MEHSIIFENANGQRKNSYDDWRLVSKKRPAFAPPKPKTNYVEIPGASYKLDLSESLTGYPLYNNREGSFDFLVLNDGQRWDVLYHEIMSFLHGQKIKAYLMDDKRWYYEGRFAVNSFDAGESASDPWSKVQIAYDVGPYRWFENSSLDEWQWDPFNFYSDVVLSSMFKNITLSNNFVGTELPAEIIGDAPLCPEITVNTENQNGAMVRFINPQLGIDIVKEIADGTATIYDFIFYGHNNVIYYKTKTNSTGTISIGFRPGRL